MLDRHQTDDSHHTMIYKENTILKVLLTMQPALGHFHPLLPLAQELQLAGHEVVFATGASLCPVVQSTGFRCVAAGHNEAVFAGITAERMIMDLLPMCRATRPDVIIRETTEFGGYLVAESLGIPHVVVQVGAYCPPEPPYDVIVPELSRLCGLLGLSSEQAVDRLYRYLLVCFAPLSYHRLGRFWPHTARTFCPAGNSKIGSEPLPLRLSHMSLRPTIYVTLGTVSNRTPGVFATILNGLRNEPLNVIATVGQDQDPAQFGPQPRNVYIERYVPQAALLPYCELVVSHGGYSTVIAALAHGLPLVMIPMFADQAENARRCATLGVGTVLNRWFLQPEAICRAAHKVWSTASYRQTAQLIQQEIWSFPGLEQAVRLIEKLGLMNSPHVSPV